MRRRSLPQCRFLFFRVWPRDQISKRTQLQGENVQLSLKPGDWLLGKDSDFAWFLRVLIADIVIRRFWLKMIHSPQNKSISKPLLALLPVSRVFYIIFNIDISIIFIFLRLNIPSLSNEKYAGNGFIAC